MPTVGLRSVVQILLCFLLCSAVQAQQEHALFTGAPTRSRIVEFAAKHRLPAIYGDELFAKDGGLMSYWSSIADVLRSAAGMVAKVLHGTKAQDIPVEYPTRFRLVVNLRTASALGLSIPYPVLMQADEVIK